MKEKDINLYDLIKFYASKWFVIVALAVVGATAGFVYSNYIQTPLYKSGATLLLTRPVDKKITLDVTMINNYVELFKSRRVIEPVIARQSLNASYEAIASAIEVTNEKNTEVIKISFSNTDSAASKSFLDGIVASFKEQVTKLYDVENVQVVDKAGSSDKPYNINKEITYIMSTAIGFVLSIILLFFVFDYRSNKKVSKKALALAAERAALKVAKKQAKADKRAQIKKAKKAKAAKAKAIRKAVRTPLKVRSQNIFKKLSDLAKKLKPVPKPKKTKQVKKPKKVVKKPKAKAPVKKKLKKSKKLKKVKAKKAKVPIKVRLQNLASRILTITNGLTTKLEQLSQPVKHMLTRKKPKKVVKNKAVNKAATAKPTGTVFYSAIASTINNRQIQLGRIFRNRNKEVTSKVDVQSMFDFIETPQKAVPVFEPKHGNLKLSQNQPAKLWSLYYDRKRFQDASKTRSISSISFSGIYAKYLKKLLDKVLAVFMLVLTTPVFAVVAILIKLESKGPAIFCQERTGLNGKNYRMFKFRSMTCNNDVRDLSKENELTRIGKVIRKLSIDELPQLINVLKGEMSFIGPRPWIPEYYQKMNHIQRHRNDVLPGITGLAQARGRNDLTINEKIAFDLGYVKRISAREDLKIIFLTAVTVIKKSGHEICKLGISHELETLERQNITAKNVANRTSERG